MSFSFSGSSGSWMRRTSGNVSNTNAFTVTFWVKRTGNFTGIKCILAILEAGDSDGHTIFCNDPAYSPYDLNFQVNYAAQQAISDDPLALDTWTFVAAVGSGANISLKYWDGSAIVTETVSQSAFVPAAVRIGDGGANAHLFTGLIADLRWWDAALNDTELEAEKDSASVVRATNLLSAHSGGGGDISTALAGESGTAYQNMGAVTYSSDAPTYDTFDGAVVSGESSMPWEVASVEGARVNRVLHSGDLSQSVWSKQGNEIVGGAVSAPTGFGTAQRVLMNIDSGGVYQLLSGIPEGHQVAVMAARKVDADYVCFRHMNSSFSAGQQGIFSFLTGEWAVTGGFGGVSGGTFGRRSIGNGWWLIWISATVSGSRIIEFYPTVGTDQLPANGRRIDVAAFQHEDVIGSVVKATYHKPTTTAGVGRSLAAVSVALASTAIGTSQTTIATAQLLDDAGAPWDQFGPVTFDSSDEAKATVTNTPGAETDLSGRITSLVEAVDNGTTDITAEAGGLSSSAVELTVSGTPIARWVRIKVEDGWQGKSGFHVGVYEKHSTDRFPDTKLFEASGQSFSSATLIEAEVDYSYMDVPVPTSVSVTEHQVVEVALENDLVDGKAVDGPGLFEAEVI